MNSLRIHIQPAQNGFVLTGMQDGIEKHRSIYLDFIGNLLRGFFFFHAEDDDTAWEMGKRIFALHYPSQHGRTVQLLKIVREGATDAGVPEAGEIPNHQRAIL